MRPDRWLYGLLLLSSLQLRAADPEAEQRRRELQALRQRIDTVQESLNRARGQRQQMAEDLEELERHMAELSDGLRTLQRDLDERQETLRRLQGERKRRETRLREDRETLAAQLRAAHLLGREQRLKLLLSQEDPGLVGRLMAYYGYLSRAHAARIADTGARIAELRAVEVEVAQERTELERLRERHAVERMQLERARAQRRELLAALEREMAEGGAELRDLQDNEARLKGLIVRLEHHATSPEKAPQQPFSRLKGQLDWPLAGRIAARYGTPRAAGGLSWDGMVINAPEGREVKAVYSGRVAFADWLRGFGMLIILDHGEGYMTLYGFNRSLLKETGEWVQAGEPIALVGDSSGRNQPGLYFGVRRRGQAQNPTSWCRTPRGGRTG
jgi:septal ring factor EnvC (AmiA/AmiB activator)